MNEAGAKGASSTAATCLLLVGDRVVLRSAGPPEAEYAMFEIGEIELRASEPGRVREHGYQTSVERARSRLANLGLTSAVARDFALAMQPVLADAYARGNAVRRITRYLGPNELLQADAFDAVTHRYRGVFLDLSVLARDLAIEHASATIHALYLTTAFEGETDDSTVLLSTDALTKGGKPGARTYKRPAFADPQRLLNALGALAQRSPRPEIGEPLARADVIAFLRTRADTAPDEDTRALYKSLEGSVSMRDMPERGPLAVPELWALEARIERNELDRLDEAIDDVERRIGRTPGTTYLRARAALNSRSEPARLIAEKVSALSLSMTSFQELVLLAAEAWLEAGEPRRAMPYARDLVDSPGVDEGLLLRAQRILARAVGAAPQKAMLVEAVPTLQASPASGTLELPPETLQSASTRRPPSSPSQIPPPPLPKQRVPSSSGRPLLEPPTLELPPPSATADAVPTFGRSIDLDLPPAESPASFTLELPAPESPSAGSTPSPDLARHSRRPRLSGVMMETRPPASISDPRAEPDSPIGPRSVTPRSPQLSQVPGRAKPSRAPTMKASSAPPPANQHDRPTPMRPPLTDQPRAPIARPVGETFGGVLDGFGEAPATAYMHGASLPPYRHENPAPLLPKAPLLPRIAGDERAEHLALPPGLGNEPRALDALPTSVLDARIQFTLLSRELGADYRVNRGIELRTDASGIEAMQSMLLEMFPDHTVSTPEQALELRRHGAFLSEILARKLDAGWLDISSNELGYWVMIVPPDTRVWPFGRVARFIAMGHKERDLVSYFFELSSRVRGR